jgi:hypothetical protein
MPTFALSQLLLTASKGCITLGTFHFNSGVGLAFVLFLTFRITEMLFV